MIKVILQVALKVPLRRLFDYLPPDSCNKPLPGQRLRVPFGENSIRIGIIISVTDRSQIPESNLKQALELLDHAPLFSGKHQQLLEWASHYYCHPLGEVVFASIPPSLRKGKAVKIGAEKLVKQNPTSWDLPLNREQQHAVDTIINNANGGYRAFLLNGVTGSGKTEVYLHIIRHILRLGKQALVLLPEIGLTPQFTAQFQQRFSENIAVIHSQLTEKERLHAWLRARNGNARIILGTRSVIWTPMHKLGLIIVDEEHDLSYKQAEGFLYSARDLALVRGRMEKIPVLLGSATPAMESLQNVANSRYQELKLTQRPGRAKLPTIKIMDVRNSKMHGAIAPELLSLIKERLQKRQQVLLFLNRRGYSPVLMCHACGFISQCHQCAVCMTYHRPGNRLLCHHCGHTKALPEICPDCAAKQLFAVGHGTQRLYETLTELLPKAKILRIDRDNTRRKGVMQALLGDIHTGDADILIGTQMLAKGHHFPRVTLVGIIDADRGLFSIDYRAGERMAQNLVQVSGRAGRSRQTGTVIIQTHYPNHPLLTALTKHDYGQFAQLLLTERKQTQLPPFSYQTLLRAAANKPQTAEKFLQLAKQKLRDTYNNTYTIYGPFPAPMEKRAGLYRFQLLIQTEHRKNLRNLLPLWAKELESIGKKIRWSLDVDPQDMM